MPEGRLAIPAVIERAVLVEAGHRCAIPTCRQVPVEIAHIVPYKDVKGHKFENLIALCPTCHARYDNGKDIDRLAMRQYKANLSLLNSRYGDLERRLLEVFAEHPDRDKVFLPEDFYLLLKYLIKDGLLIRMPKFVIPFSSGMPAPDEYRLTEAGRAFVTEWVANHPLT